MPLSETAWTNVYQSNTTLILSQEIGIVDRILQSVSLSMIMAGALIFNTLITFVILRVKSLRRVPHNLLILNLAIADLGVVLCSMVFSLVSIFDDGFFLTSYRIVCMVQGFLAIMLSFTNLPTILSIAVDRLLIVVFSRHFQPNRIRVLFMVAVSWLVGVTIACISATREDSRIGFHPATLHCSLMWWESNSFRIGAIIVNYGFFVPALLLCYLLIIYYLRKKDRRLGSHSRSRRVPSSVTEDAISNLDVDVPQESGEVNENWICLQCSSPSRDRDVESSITNANHHSQIKESRVNNLHQMTARMKRVKTERGRHMAHKRVAKMAIMLVLAIVTCWTPYLLFHSRLIPGSENTRLGVFTMWLAYCNPLLDPLIYAFVNRSVRAEMHKVLRNIRSNITSIGTKCDLLTPET